MADRHDIICLPNEHLRQKSKRIHVITDDVLETISDMETATLDWEDSRAHEIGVALAAVQIDKLEQIVIIRNDFDDKENRSFTILINPEIIKAEGEIEYDHEGCLSVDGVYGLVPRYNKVRVKALDVSGNEIRIKADGFLARILQHEIDHLKGTLFVDHVKDDKGFFKLTKEGNLKRIDYAEIEAAGILRD